VTTAVWHSAVRRAEAFLGEPVDVQPVSDLLEAVRALAQAESYMQEYEGMVPALHALGWLTPHDAREYDRLRSNMAKAQGPVLAAVRRVLGRTAPEALSEIPSKVRRAPPLVELIERPLRAPTTGLGAAPIAAGWVVALIILAVLARLGAIAAIAYAVGLTAEALRDVLIVHEQTKAFTVAARSRIEAYERCMAGGGTPEVCSAQAVELVPDPPDIRALPGIGGWVPWVFGTAVVGLLGTGMVLWWRRGGRAGRSLGVRGLPPAGSMRRLSQESFETYDHNKDPGLKV
jgi:hypothetical protein